jgi:hypothetical protein
VQKELFKDKKEAKPIETYEECIEETAEFESPRINSIE